MIHDDVHVLLDPPTGKHNGFVTHDKKKKICSRSRSGKQIRCNMEFTCTPYRLLLMFLLIPTTFEDAFVSDVNSLSELPLDNLLRVRNSIELRNKDEKEGRNSEENDLESKAVGPQALRSEYQKYLSGFKLNQKPN